MPLECVLRRKGDGKEMINFELCSERVMLRHRVCRLVSEKLVEGIGIRMNALLHLLEIVCQPDGERQNGNKLVNDTARKLNKDKLTLRSAALRVLIHTTAMEGRYLCSCITSYRKGAAVTTLLNMLQYTAKVQAESNGLDNDIDTFSQGLALATLRNLVSSRCLAYNQLLSSTHAALSCIESTDDIRVTAAGFSLLSSIIALSSSSADKQGNVSNINKEDFADSDTEPILLAKEECTALTNAVCRGAMSNSVAIVIFRVLESHLNSNNTASHVDNEIVSGAVVSKADPSMWLTGSEFGHRQGGMYDGLLSLISTIASIYPNFTTIVSTDDPTVTLSSLVSRVLQSSGNGELSPIGVASALKFLSLRLANLLITNATTNGSDVLLHVKNEGIVGIASLACLPIHLELCHMWGLVTQSQSAAGGDTWIEPNALSPGHIVNSILSASSSILRTIMHSIGNITATDAQNKESQAILEGIYKTQFIKCFLEAMRIYGSKLSDDTITCIIHVLSELVLTSSKFITQFVDAQGLEVIDELPNPLIPQVNDSKYYNVSGIDSESRIEALMCYLQIASHLARHSEKHYALLQDVFTPYKLILLLSPSIANTGLRAKTCNLIGNLCRHSNRFYQSLSSYVDLPFPNNNGSQRLTVLSLLIQCCGDKDLSVKKFACFAIGNAAFHSNELYSYLSSSIPMLRDAMDDVDEKTRANAAGAIGNLVRNGNELASIMVKERIVETLLTTILHDRDIAPRRIALFSLGTMSVHTPCRECVLKARNPSVNDVVKLLRDSNEGVGAADEILTKYLIRLKQKLKGGNTANSANNTPNNDEKRGNSDNPSPIPS